MNQEININKIESIGEKMIINHESDYSNILPTINCVAYLVQYCSEVYQHFLNLIKEDEEKNQKFKEEYKNYQYKRSYGEHFEIYIREKSYNNITCKDNEEFQTVIKNGDLNQVLELKITLDLDFKRGQGLGLVNHENTFTIIFQPYNIKLARKSNHQDNEMDKIEENIKEILNQFPVANCIFCNK